jgi:hypothetical protein
MRQKPHSNRFKRLRHAMNQLEVDPTERAYDRMRVRRRAEPVGFQVDAEGVPQVVYYRYETYTNVLRQSCGRSIYQATKRAA